MVSGASWQDVALVVANVTQIVLLAWITSRSARRRRGDER
jgi:hypothetical protein